MSPGPLDVLPVELVAQLLLFMLLAENTHSSEIDTGSTQDES